MIEEWRPVVGHEGVYEVSDQGRIRSLDRKGHPGRVLKAAPDSKSKYFCVRTSHHGARVRLYVHREVLKAFVGPAEGRWGLHDDDDHLNNQLSNLRWGTQSENISDMWKNGILRRKTHCINAHEMTPENTISYKNVRRCRTCKNDLARLRRARKKEVV